MLPAADLRSHRAPAHRPASPPRPARETGSAAPDALSPTLGSWQLVARIATVDYATLYQARPVTQRQEAPADYLVKVARSDAPLNLAAALLRREKFAARRVSHPHLPAVVASGLTHEPPFLVLAGGAVAAMKTVREDFPLRVALWRARQTAAALAALHSAGWIHSRLAPSALLFSQRGHLTVHELGWSRQIGTAECRGDHLLAADLRYVAPEMLCDATVLTPACDVYCLGLLLIEMLIGRPAVDASIGWQAALVHLRGQLASVRELRPDLPGSLVRLIARMTAGEPLRRPSALEMERELVRQEVSCLTAKTSEKPIIRRMNQENDNDKPYRQLEAAMRNER